MDLAPRDAVVLTTVQSSEARPKGVNLKERKVGFTKNTAMRHRRVGGRLSFGVGDIFQNVSPVWTRLNQTYSFEKSSVSLKDHGTEGLFFKTYPTLLTYSCSYASSYGVWRPSGEGVGGASRRCAPQRGKGIVAR